MIVPSSLALVVVTATGAAADNYSAAILNDGPTGYWRLNDAGPTAADATGHGNTCTKTGSPTFGAPGLLATSSDAAVGVSAGGVLTCQPSSGEISLSGNTATLEAWVKPTANDWPGTFVGVGGAGTGNDLQLGEGQAGQGTRFTLRAAGSTSGFVTLNGPILVLGFTYHIVAVFNAGTLSLYVNGTLFGTTNVAGTLVAHGILEIGNDPATNATSDGTVDEVAVYTSALTAARISAHFVAGNPGPGVGQDAYSSAVLSQSPAGYWRLGDPVNAQYAQGAAAGQNCVPRASPTYGAGSLLPSTTDTAAAFGDNYLQCGQFNRDAGTATLEAWVKPTANLWPTTYVGLGAPGGGNGLTLSQVQAGQGFRARLSAVGATSGPVNVDGPILVVGHTYHLAGVVANGAVSFYVDGSLFGTASLSGGLVAHGNLDIGADPAGPDASQATIDEVALYTTALTASQVSAHFVAGNPGPGSGQDAFSSTISSIGPLAYWRLGDPPDSQFAHGAPEGNNCVPRATPTFGAPGLLATSSDTAVAFNGDNYLQCPQYSLDGGSASLVAVIYPDRVSWPGTFFGIDSPGGGSAFRLGEDWDSPHNSTDTVFTETVTTSLGTTTHFPGAPNQGFATGGLANTKIPGPFLVMLTFENGVLKLWVNLVLKEQVTLGGTLAAHGNLYIATNPATAEGAQNSSGAVDEVALFDKALTPSQVQDIGTAAGFQPPPLVTTPVGATADQLAGQVSNAATRCTCSVSSSYGQPIVTPWGNFTHTFTDFSFPGRGPELNFSRTYSSYPNMAVPGGQRLGPGWSQPYGSKIAVTGTSPDRIATITQENGAQATFYETTANSWAPTAPRLIATLTYSGGTYTFTRQASDIFIFDAATGHLNAIKDQNGYTESMAYDASQRLLTVTDESGRTLTFAYDASSHMQSVTDFTGRAASFTYGSTSGDLLTATEPDGGVWTFTYDANHRMLTMLDPKQAGSGSPKPVTNHYDAQGRVDWQKDPLLQQTSFDYSNVVIDASGANGTVVITDPKGFKIQETYQYGLKTAVTTGFGTASSATTRYIYDPGTFRPLYITDPNRHTSSYTYDASGNTLTATDALNRQTVSTFNAFNEPLTIKDPSNVTTTYTYDSHGNLSTESRPCILPDGVTSCGTRTTSLFYDPAHAGDVTSSKDANLRTTSYTYDGDGNVVTMTDPLGNVTTNTYDRLGRKIATYQPTGENTATRYDAMNRPLETVNQLGYPIMDSFNRSNSAGLGRPASYPAGYPTWLNISGGWGVSNGRAYVPGTAVPNISTVTQAFPNGIVDGTVKATVATPQNGIGLVFRVQDASNFWNVRMHSTSTAWDLYKKVAGVSTLVASSAAGTCCTSNTRLAVTYYQNGEIYVTVNGAVVIQAADTALADATDVGLFENPVGAGRIEDFVSYANQTPDDFSGVNRSGVATNTYDRNGNVISQTDADSNVTTNAYDLAGQLCWTVDGTSTNSCSSPPTGATSYQYDFDGNRTSVKDGNGHSTTYAFDDPAYPNLETSMTMPGIGVPTGQQTQYDYDPAGRLQVITDPSNRTTTRAYDAADQLTSASYSDPGTPDVTNITYDTDGRRTGLTDAAGTSSWTWDSLGQPRTSTIGSTGTVTYGYDIAGNQTSIDYPNSVGTVTRHFDNNERLDWVQDPLLHKTTFVYDADSNLQTIGYPNTKTSTLLHDAANRVSSIDLGSSLYIYGRTPAGQLSSQFDTGSPLFANYTYDQRNRLLTDDTGTNTYDKANNPTGVDTGVQQAFNEANQLCWTLVGTSANSCGTTPIGATTYQYDAQGNRTETAVSGGPTTIYSYDQADRLTAVPNVSASYTYNADSLRTTKTVGAAVTTFTWDQTNGTPPLLQEKTGSSVTSYIYGPGGIPVEQLAGTTPSYLQQDQLGSTRYLTNQAGTVVGTYRYTPYGATATHTGATTNLQYAGQYTDAETGFQYLRNRYYDPATAQFLTQDPALAVTESAFGYVRGDPLNGVDPSGLVGFSIGPVTVGDGCPLGKNPNGSCRGSGVVDKAVDVTVAVGNAPVTAVTAIVNVGTGGHCGTGKHLTVVCEGGVLSDLNSTVFTTGNTINVSTRYVSHFRDHPEIVDHEWRHSIQEDILGPAFYPLYGASWAFSQVFTGGQCWNPFEWQAGFKKGQYTCC